MKITGLRTRIVAIPYDPPVLMGGLTVRTGGCLLAYVDSDQGVTGEGLVYSHNGNRIGILRDMAQSLAPLLEGLDPTDAGAFLTKAEAVYRHFGREGVSVLGLSAVESALTDLRAKLLGTSVAAMLGACRTAIPCYHSGDLWTGMTLDELQRSAEAHIAAGYRAMKARLSGDLAEDVARVRALREAVGPDIALMADLNQRLTVPQAIRHGRALEEFGLAWLEEPVAAHDHEGEAQVAAALDTPLSSGESVWLPAGVMRMLTSRACDIVSLDLPRMGGPTGFMRAATLAAAHDIPATNHMYHEHSLALMAAIPNAGPLEVLPMTSPLFLQQLELDPQGRALVPDRPGWGFDLDPDKVEAWAA